MSESDQPASPVAQEGDFVKVAYEGRLSDGTVFDQTSVDEPFELQLGSPETIPGFWRGIVGMAAGTKRTVELPPDQAYGDSDPRRVQRIPIDQLPEGVQVGDTLRARADAVDFHLHVTEMDDKEAVLDANHPLAGQTLTFDITLVEIRGGMSV